MVSLLQRACVGLDVSSEPGAGNPVETQTLSLGMGLIATLLSSPQVLKAQMFVLRLIQIFILTTHTCGTSSSVKFSSSSCPETPKSPGVSSVTSQLSADDCCCMSRLLPHLQTLSLQHPDPLVQELASNLRAVIATHGAYRPEDLAAAGAGQSSKHRETTPEMRSEGNVSQSSVRTSSRHPEPSQRPGPKDDPDSSNKPFSDWLLEACDPEVPTRAFALRVLTQKVQRRDPEAVQAQEKVLLVCGFVLLSVVLVFVNNKQVRP